MNKKLVAASALAMMTLPLLALAGFNPGSVPAARPDLSIIELIDVVIGFVWPVVVIAIVLLFTFAAFQFFTANGDPEKIKTARDAFIWGVAGTVVIFLAWSIPFIVRNTLEV